MNKLDTIITVVALSISTTILFQNCSGPQASDTRATVVQENQSSNTDTDYSHLTPAPAPEKKEEIPAPVVILNKNFDLDNVLVSGQISPSLGNGNAFIYETLYLAETNSTTLTFAMNSNSSAMVMTVDADSCNDSKSISTQADIDTFLNLYNSILADAGGASRFRSLAANETVTPGCNFPRVVMNIANPQINDYDLYLGHEECVPDSVLYIPDVKAGEANESIRTALEALFKGHIDEICGL